MKSKMTNRNKTFWIIAILVIALFFTFNTLPMIKGVIYSFTNYKGYGSYDVVGWRNYVDLLPMRESEKVTCLLLNMLSPEQFSLMY